MSQRLIHELRAKFPGLANAADRNSRRAGIMGGSYAEVDRCPAFGCPLYLFRLGRATKTADRKRQSDFYALGGPTLPLDKENG